MQNRKGIRTYPIKMSYPVLRAKEKAKAKAMKEKAQTTKEKEAKSLKASKDKEKDKEKIRTGVVSGKGTLFMNHYKSKSFEEWNEKVTNLDNQGYMKNKWSDIGFQKYEENDNAEKDTRILRFVTPLEKFLQEPLFLRQQKKDTNNTNTNTNKKKYFLTMVCMFKAEDAYLDEWIRFHILQGVEHFYLYDNENGPETHVLLKPYIDANYVTLIYWPNSKIESVPKHLRRTQWFEHKKLSVQNLAFKHFTEHFNDQYQWVIKADVDEFVYPNEKYTSVKETLKKKYPANKIKGIEVPRKNFGSSGLIKKPSGPVIKNYTRCAPRPMNHKSIGNSDFIRKPSFKVHSFNYK